jgi:molybdate transport system substrate-binding protein
MTRSEVHENEAIAGAALTMVVLTAAGAAEVKVLSAGALEPGMKAAAAEFQKASGHSVKLAFNTAPQIRKRIADGEVHDVVVAPPAVIDEFSKAGKLGQDRADVGRVGMGVAVRPGAPAPDISSPEALKKSVLDAESPSSTAPRPGST